MIVALPPTVYSRTDSGVVSPARAALTESRNSGLKGSDERLSKALPVAGTMNFERPTRNPALRPAWRTNAPGTYSPIPPELRLRVADCALGPWRMVIAWSCAIAERGTYALDAAPTDARASALGPPSVPSCRVTMFITPLIASV